MDNLDRKLLSILQHDADLSRAELADRVGLSTAACAKRVARFWKDGLIDKMIVVLNRAKFRKPVSTAVMISLVAPKINVVAEFERAMQSHERVLKMCALSGDFDYFLLICSETIEDYFNFATNVLGDMASVRYYQSHFVLKSIKDEIGLPDSCI